MTKTKLTLDNIYRQPHYQNILQLIIDAQNRKKKITFDHLKCVLVRGIGDKLPDSKVDKIRDFFQYDKPQIWPGKDGRLKEISSIIQFMVLVSGVLGFEKQQISSVNNLTNFLDRLLKIGFIEKKRIGRKKPYYVVTHRGAFYLHRYIIEMDVEIFLDYVFDVKRPKNKSYCMLTRFESDIEKSIGKIISSR